VTATISSEPALRSSRRIIVERDIAVDNQSGRCRAETLLRLVGQSRRTAQDCQCNSQSFQSAFEGDPVRHVVLSEVILFSMRKFPLNKRIMKSLLLLCAILCLPAVVFGGSLPSACSDGLLAKIPARQPSSLTGSEFALRVEDLSGLDREQQIQSELLAGDMPQFLRRVAPITMSGQLPDGRNVKITVCVLTDYLAIGSDHDFLFIPMRLATALNVAGRFGFTLPTKKIVDAIYDEATVHLAPQPLPANDEMRSTDYYWHHNELIAEQRTELGVEPGVLTAGHKKDLVITNRLWRFPDRVAIYGWHRAMDCPIQPLSTVHGARYADYSHGVRLVSTTICVNGKSMSIYDALADPALAGILSGEGPLFRVTDLISKLAALRLDLLPTFPDTTSPSAMLSPM
jgi:hypothetical protein